jgi:Spy/CpxP family protein refolding chaperone
VQEAGKELGAVLKEEFEKIRPFLTPEQLKKVDEMKEEREEYKEGLAQRIAHLGEMELTDAETAKIQEIRYQYRPQIEKAMKDLGGILTEQQKQARAEGLKAGKSRREVLASLNLTDDQKERVAAAAKQVRGLVRDELDKMRAILTEEQQAKLGDERAERVHDRRVQRIADLKELNLTAEQKTKIADIREEFRPRVQEAATKLRVVVREELQAILAVLKA